MIALGVLAGVWLAGRRMEANGSGTREDMSVRAVGRAGRHHRVPHLPRHHGLAPVPGALARRVQDLGGRPRHLGGIGLGVAVGIWAACAAAYRCRPGCRPSRRRCRSRRPSDGGATGGTRSCSGGPPISRGRSRCPPRRPWPPGSSRARCSTRPSSTSPCGGVPLRRPDLDRQARPAPGNRAVRHVRRRLHVHAVLDRAAPSIRPRSCGAGGSTRSSRSSCSCSPWPTSSCRCAGRGPWLRPRVRVMRSPIQTTTSTKATSHEVVTSDRADRAIWRDHFGPLVRIAGSPPAPEL